MFSFKKNNTINGKIWGLLALLLLGGSAFSAVPNWSVNSGSYQYSMTFIAALNIQGTESVNASDMVGAFVKGQCRGVAKPSVVQAGTGRHLAYLLVYSNVTKGDTIVFKVYDSTRDSVFTVPNKIAFQSDVSKGVSSDPYVIYTDNAIAKQSFTLKENSPANTSVGTVVATNKYGGPLTYKFGKANHDSTFTIVPSTGEIKVQNSTKLDYETTRAFSFYVVVSNSGTTPLTDSGLVVIALLNVNEAPVIKSQDFSVNENAPANTFVGSLKASDVDSGHVIKYHLAGISPDFGSANPPFTINENTGEIIVVSAAHLDYETTRVFTMKVIVEDEFHAKDSTAVTVHLINQIENTVKAFNMFSPNGDGSNDFWEIENVDLYKGFKVTIFDSAGEIVFEKTDYKNDWDGTYKGKAVPEGMYYYSLKSPDYNQDYKGAITIMR
jgi:gliding motility-associated-like protein